MYFNYNYLKNIDLVMKLFLSTVFILCIIIFYLSMITGKSTNIIISDGQGYYVWLRSIFFDFDLNLTNDYVLVMKPEIFNSSNHITNVAGNATSKYPIGVAISMIPGFIIGHAIALLMSFDLDGVSHPYQLSISSYISALTLFSFYFFYKSLCTISNNKVTAFILVVIAILSTNLIYYLTKEPAMSHCLNVAMLNFLLYFGIKINNKNFIFNNLNIFIISLCGGLLFLQRFSNIFLMPFLVYLYLPLFRKNNIRWITQLLFFLFFFLSLQLLINHISYNIFLPEPYINEGFNSGINGIIGTLFSDKHGLIKYHPIYFIGIVLSLLLLKFQKWRITASLIILCFVILWQINGNWDSWSFGDSFGNRGFIESIPLLTLSSYLFIVYVSSRRLKHFLLVLSSILILFNCYLYIGYMLKKYPHSGDHTFLRVIKWYQY